MKKDVAECEKKGEASKHSARGGDDTAVNRKIIFFRKNTARKHALFYS
jgi:hypothetical protein